MVNKVLRFMATLGGAVLGIYFFTFLLPMVGLAVNVSETGFFGLTTLVIVYYAAGALLIGLIFYLIAPVFINIFNRILTWADSKLKVVPIQDIVLFVFGLVITLIIGVLLSFPIYRIPVVGVFISPVLTFFTVFIGIRFLFNRKAEFSFITTILGRGARSGSGANEVYKILDTSAIIDGRIVDICKTGFLEGVIVVADFVLEELRHIADSPDSLKRNRGRRGLDVLNKIQKEMDTPVQIYEGDFEDLTEVDSKLVRLAKTINGKVVTNDFNLNKVCELQGIAVLNINELANAVKPVVLPGEEMVAQIVKDGKEAGQGVAYLDDGTMVVVEGGRRHIGEAIEVLVTSVLQTAAGRMIFAKPKQDAEKYSGVK